MCVLSTSESSQQPEHHHHPRWGWRHVWTSREMEQLLDELEALSGAETRELSASQCPGTQLVPSSTPLGRKGNLSGCGSTSDAILTGEWWDLRPSCRTWHDPLSLSYIYSRPYQEVTRYGFGPTDLLIYYCNSDNFFKKMRAVEPRHVITATCVHSWIHFFELNDSRTLV